jgi:hypothetical protein
MPESAIETTVRKLRRSGLASTSEIHGCTDKQIHGLESHLGIRLPSTYRAFLSLMGMGAGRFLDS